ncbi:MAG: hypothetical protein QHH01_02270 [Spirochaetales bacterium]|nr:hypothetical protein [Spirochaetales bacterium]
MASLDEVVGAIMSQIGKGRSQADLATIEVAKLYREHPLLAAFPVPRLSLDEVVIDLKVSMANAPVTKRSLDVQTRTEIAAGMERLLAQLPEEETELQNLQKRYKGLARLWQGRSPLIKETVASLLPAEMTTGQRQVAEGLATLLCGQLSSALLSPEAGVAKTRSAEFLKKELPRIQTKLADRALQIMDDVLKKRPPITESLEVLVTASELQNIPPEKITTLHITLRESDRSWTQVETGRGAIEDRLVPD